MRPQAARTLRRQPEIELLVVLESVDGLPGRAAGFVAIQGDATQATEQDAEWKPEQRLLGKESNVEALGDFIDQRPHAVPIRCVWSRDKYRLVDIGLAADGGPAAQFQQSPRNRAPH